MLLDNAILLMYNFYMQYADFAVQSKSVFTEVYISGIEQ